MSGNNSLRLKSIATALREMEAVMRRMTEEVVEGGEGFPLGLWLKETSNALGNVIVPLERAIEEIGKGDIIQGEVHEDEILKQLGKQVHEATVALFQESGVQLGGGIPGVPTDASIATEEETTPTRRMSYEEKEFHKMLAGPFFFDMVKVNTATGLVELTDPNASGSTDGE